MYMGKWQLYFNRLGSSKHKKIDNSSANEKPQLSWKPQSLGASLSAYGVMFVKTVCCRTEKWCYIPWVLLLFLLLLQLQISIQSTTYITAYIMPYGA